MNKKKPEEPLAHWNLRLSPHTIEALESEAASMFPPSAGRTLARAILERHVRQVAKKKAKAA